MNEHRKSGLANLSSAAAGGMALAAGAAQMLIPVHPDPFDEDARRGLPWGWNAIGQHTRSKPKGPSRKRAKVKAARAQRRKQRK